MKKRIFSLMISIVVIAFLTGCNPNQNPSATVSATLSASVTTTAVATITPAPSIAKNHVLIQNFAFDPTNLVIQVGDTVVWENKDISIHQIVLPDISSPTMAKNDTFSHTFTTAGTFDYHCGIHLYMSGKIVVQ
jgi:plastocyanin